MAIKTSKLGGLLRCRYFDRAFDLWTVFVTTWRSQAWLCTTPDMPRYYLATTADVTPYVESSVKLQYARLFV